MLMLTDFLESQCLKVCPRSVVQSDLELDMFGGEFIGQCSPLFRWAGGKTQLLSAIQFYAPKTYKAYYEPFIGGAALLFALMPNKCVINDVNPVISTFYRVVRDNYCDLVCLLDTLEKLPDTEEIFLNLRGIFNDYVLHDNFGIETSALFLYLNAKCFNGLYRVNSKGEFNVGWAKESVKTALYSKQALKCAHDFFNHSNIAIMNGDFMECTEICSENDFVYFDPPYVPVDSVKNFTSYDKSGFTLEDQERLAKEFKRLTGLGVKCMLSNSESDLVLDLYSEYKIRKLGVNYYIQPNSKEIKRNELLITNY